MNTQCVLSYVVHKSDPGPESDFYWLLGRGAPAHFVSTKKQPRGCKVETKVQKRRRQLKQTTNEQTS